MTTNESWRRYLEAGAAAGQETLARAEQIARGLMAPTEAQRRSARRDLAYLTRLGRRVGEQLADTARVGLSRQLDTVSVGPIDEFLHRVADVVRSPTVDSAPPAEPGSPVDRHPAPEDSLTTQLVVVDTLVTETAVTETAVIDTAVIDTAVIEPDVASPPARHGEVKAEGKKRKKKDEKKDDKRTKAAKKTKRGKEKNNKDKKGKKHTKGHANKPDVPEGLAAPTRVLTLAPPPAASGPN